MDRAINVPTLGLGILTLTFLLFQSVPLWAVELADFRQIVKDNEPAVVNISTTQKVSGVPGFGGPLIPNIPKDSPLYEFFKRFFEEGPNRPAPEREAHSLGSGFVISPDGYIVTNAHVVKDAEEIIVRFSDDLEKPAKVIGLDERSDVALLKIGGVNLTTVKIGNSDALEVGEWVVAIGSPFGLEHTATAGIVSAVGRNLPSDVYVPFIQTDVAVNPGNSGGPLFNTQGRVVGINAQIYSRTGGYMGLSFAIPINVAMQVADQLKTQGHVTRGWLGVMIQGIDQDLAQSFGLERPRGALVSQVMPDSPAAKAGLQVGDIILDYDGHAIERWSQLPSMVGITPTGKTVPVLILRDGKTQTIEVTIEELKGEIQVSAAGKAQRQETRLNIAVTDLTREQREERGIDEGGVLVAEVNPGPAADSGVRSGDVILALDRREVKDVAQFAELVKGLPAGKAVPVLVQRDGNSLFLALKVPQ